ncbi:hypothetical protein [Pandoravirus japonicus]|uniref:Transmembrane protein n=1 Tax=Pandoravirus japonicus TaxID=2823154 RepID=A0A811BQL0_9VIRU|nr:hypothetical protein [Pandoravirus japonicus]
MGPRTPATGITHSHEPIGLGRRPISFFGPYFSLCESFVFLCCQLACDARDVAGVASPLLGLRGASSSFFLFLFDGMALRSSAPLDHGARVISFFYNFSFLLLCMCMPIWRCQNILFSFLGPGPLCLFCPWRAEGAQKGP